MSISERIKNIKWIPLIISIVISLGVGGLSAFFTRNSMDTYKKYNLPLLAPPGFIFPIVWTILFILMGISAYIIFTSDAESREKTNALFLYGLQLVLNFFWSIIFFNMDMLFFSFIWIIFLWITVFFMFISFKNINKLAGYLQIPYLVWLTFAAYLNLGIFVLNR